MLITFDCHSSSLVTIMKIYDQDVMRRCFFGWCWHFLIHSTERLDANLRRLIFSPVRIVLVGFQFAFDNFTRTLTPFFFFNSVQTEIYLHIKKPNQIYKKPIKKKKDAHKIISHPPLLKEGHEAWRKHCLQGICDPNIKLSSFSCWTGKEENITNGLVFSTFETSDDSKWLLTFLLVFFFKVS